MAIPTIPTSLAGQKITATQLNAVKTAVEYWSGNSPRCHVYNTGGQSFANSTDVLCLYTDELADNAGMHSTVSNTSRIILPETGTYDINFFATLSTATYTGFNVLCRKNAAGSTAGGTSIRTELFGYNAVKWTFWYPFTAGDYLEFWINQTSGGARTASTTSLGFGVQVRLTGT